MTLPGFHECPECGGTGEPFQIVDFSGGVHLACPECGGAGQVPDDDTVEVAAKALNLDMALDTLLGSWQKSPGCSARLRPPHPGDDVTVFYCQNHYQLGNELWCTYGRIWDKECRMVLADLHPRPEQEEPS